MKRGGLIVAMALGLSAPSWAQERDNPYYPETARDQGMGGRVTLDCLVEENGRLACTVAEETPAYWEFGDAALAYSREWRVSMLTHTGESTAGAHLNRMVVFDPGPPARIFHGWPPRQPVNEAARRD